MATYNPDRSYKKITDKETREAFERIDTLLEYMFSSLTIDENCTSNQAEEYKKMKEEIEELKRRVAALES